MVRGCCVFIAGKLGAVHRVPATNFRVHTEGRLGDRVKCCCVSTFGLTHFWKGFSYGKEV
jgi:hypothetical protein